MDHPGHRPQAELCSWIRAQHLSCDVQNEIAGQKTAMTNAGGGIMNIMNARAANNNNHRPALSSGMILVCLGLVSVVEQRQQYGSSGSASFFVHAENFSPAPPSPSSPLSISIGESAINSPTNYYDYPAPPVAVERSMSAQDSPSGSISGYAFFDSKGDGVRDVATSAGISGTFLSLFTCNDEMVNSKTTGTSGYYSFSDLYGGQYYIRATPPQWYAFGDAWKGKTIEGGLPNLKADSAVDPDTGRTACFDLDEGEGKAVSFGLALDVSSHHSGPTTASPSDTLSNAPSDAPSDSPSNARMDMGVEHDHSLIKTSQNTSTASEPSDHGISLSSQSPSTPPVTSDTGELTSYGMYYAMVIAAKISGGLSLIASLFVVRDIFKQCRTPRCTESLPTTTYLVLSMSVADVGTSFWLHVVGPWMVPSGDGFPFAVGNIATCQAQAFLSTTLLCATTITSAMLALVYWLTVCKSKPEKELQTWKWRALLYGFPWGFGVVWAAVNRILITPYEALNLPNWWCYNAFGEPGTVAFDVTTIGALVAGINTFLLLSACMISLMRFVHRQERRMDRFSMGDSNRERTSQVTKQGALYIVGFMVMYIPFAIKSIASFWPGEPPVPRGYYVLFSILFPSQGLINAFIYFRPKVNRKMNREGLSRGQSVLRTLEVPLPPSSVTSAVRSLRSLGSFGGSPRVPGRRMKQPADEDSSK